MPATSTTEGDSEPRLKPKMGGPEMILSLSETGCVKIALSLCLVEGRPRGAEGQS